MTSDSRMDFVSDAFMAAYDRRNAALNALAGLQTKCVAADRRGRRLSAEAVVTGYWDVANANGKREVRLFQKRDQLIAELIAADKEYQALESA